MDDTQPEQLLHEMESADPAAAPELADALAEALEAGLERPGDDEEPPS